jgi:hypothetical protein
MKAVAVPYPVTTLVLPSDNTGQAL